MYADFFYKANELSLADSEHISGLYFHFSLPLFSGKEKLSKVISTEISELFVIKCLFLGHIIKQTSINLFI